MQPIIAEVSNAVYSAADRPEKSPSIATQFAWSRVWPSEHQHECHESHCAGHQTVLFPSDDNVLTPVDARCLALYQQSNSPHIRHRPAAVWILHLSIMSIRGKRRNCFAILRLLWATARAFRSFSSARPGTPSGTFLRCRGPAHFIFCPAEDWFCQARRERQPNQLGQPIQSAGYALNSTWSHARRSTLVPSAV